VPPGFVIEQVAAAPDVVFPMFAGFDDRGRLFVAESSGLDLYKEVQELTRKCRIRLLEDPDENGRFRKSTVWAENLVFPMGLVWRDGKLYVADPPDLITLEDTKGAGKTDKRTVILSGFGHRDNGSLHGLTFGPEGRLYFTMGDPDGYKLTGKDGSRVEGTTGALLRCRPDGSEVEVLCSGFENLVEVVFTPRGEIIGTDNWYQNPVGGIRDALIHLVPGGRYPKHADKKAPLPFTGEPLPAMSLFPAVALSGLMRYEGSSFGGMHSHLFAAQHNSRKISRHVLIPSGSTFKTEDYDFLTTDDPDFHPSDVLESADGSIYVVDTGSWYVHHCPTGQIRKTEWKGGIYRVRPEKMPAIDDPWGLKIDWKQQTVEQLIGHLADPRAVVRHKARETLVGRGEAVLSYDLVSRVLKEQVSVAVGQQLIWVLARIPGGRAHRSLTLLAVGSRNADLQAAALRAFSIREDEPTTIAEPLSRRLLESESPAVRLAAAEGFARGRIKPVEALWEALTKQPDRIEEHALIHAIHQRTDKGSDLVDKLGDTNPHASRRPRCFCWINRRGPKDC
jgi:putative membrane-bound dehydrogenase-like protein